jgi:hypothetical protein
MGAQVGNGQRRVEPLAEACHTPAVMADEDDLEQPDPDYPPAKAKITPQSFAEGFAQSRVWLPQAIARLVERLKARRAS